MYAPGVTGYIPIALKLQPSLAFRADPVSYPQPKKIRLKAIHETALVYDRQFRLVETITLASEQDVGPLLDQNHDLTVRGELRYQACDDQQCFIPETVSVRWTVPVLPFDRTRVPESLRRR